MLNNGPGGLRIEWEATIESASMTGSRPFNLPVEIHLPRPGASIAVTQVVSALSAGSQNTTLSIWSLLVLLRSFLLLSPPMPELRFWNEVICDLFKIALKIKRLTF